VKSWHDSRICQIISVGNFAKGSIFGTIDKFMNIVDICRAKGKEKEKEKEKENEKEEVEYNIYCRGRNPGIHNCFQSLVSSRDHLIGWYVL
jgi:hypothetical protein